MCKGVHRIWCLNLAGKFLCLWSWAMKNCLPNFNALFQCGWEGGRVWKRAREYNRKNQTSTLGHWIWITKIPLDFGWDILPLCVSFFFSRKEGEGGVPLKMSHVIFRLAMFKWRFFSVICSFHLRKRYFQVFGTGEYCGRGSGWTKHWSFEGLSLIKMWDEVLASVLIQCKDWVVLEFSFMHHSFFLRKVAISLQKC